MARVMRGLKRAAVGAVGLALTLVVGCNSIPPLDNPLMVKPKVADEPSSVVFAGGQPGCAGYDEIYERVLDALDDYFELIPSSRYSRVVQTFPRIAPGFEQPWKGSTPSASERWLATFQTLRHYAIARIGEAENGGYRVTIEVYKETENNGGTLLSLGARSHLRVVPEIDRRSELVDGPRTPEANWYPAGKYPHRDFAFEQVILQKILRPDGIK